MPNTETTTPRTPIARDALIRDLAITLAGMLHHTAEAVPGRVAACRLRDVLGIEDGEGPRGIEARLRAVLDGAAHRLHPRRRRGHYRRRCPAEPLRSP